jgi:mono/diheme cytochrome c family protein
MQSSFILRSLYGLLIVSLLACATPTPAVLAPTVAPPTPTAEAVQPTAVPATATVIVQPPTAAPATVVPPTDTASIPSSTPISTAAPATATIAVPQPTPVPASATPVPATTGPLTASQIGATAIANAAGEECAATEPQPAKGFIGNPVRGKMLFSDRGCSACHGDLAQGNIGPKLAGTTLAFSAVIQQLRSPRGVMQRYLPADQSDADECDVYTYVRSLK